MREEALDRQDRLRGRLRKMRGRASDELVASPARWRQLRSEGEEIGRALERHICWEDRNLVPVLRDADAWGSERVARLRADHSRQRCSLSALLTRLRDERRSPEHLAKELLALARRLDRDLLRERREALTANVVRDDVVSIDLEAG